MSEHKRGGAFARTHVPRPSPDLNMERFGEGSKKRKRRDSGIKPGRNKQPRLEVVGKLTSALNWAWEVSTSTEGPAY